MKKIGFVGSYDKTDMLLYIAKILTVLGNKIIIIDSTLLQKSRYVVPVINPTKTYITTYEDIDVAIGFEDLKGIKEYLSLKEEEELEYDIALMDVDSSQMIENFGLNGNDKMFFVTSFDIYSLKRGLEAISNLKDPITMSKVYYSKNMLMEEDDYLNFLSLPYKVIWEEEIIYFPFEQGDQSAIFENQRTSRIKLKNLSIQYIDSIAYITEGISKFSTNDIRKAIKFIEKT